MKAFFFIFFISIFLTGLGCDEHKSSPVGGDIIDGEDMGQFGEVHIQTAIKEAVSLETKPTHTGYLLLVGDCCGYQTKSLLKFKIVLPESIEVIDASVILATYDVLSQAQPSDTDTMGIIVSLTETKWDESTVTFDSPLHESQVETVTVRGSGDDILIFSLPTEELLSAIGQDSLIGLQLSSAEEHNAPQGGGFINEFYSSESYSPMLSITWTENDTSDTTTNIFYPVEDVFVVDRNTEWPFDLGTERLVVGHGYGDRASINHQSLLQFDIQDSIFEEVTIIEGLLTLFLDHEYSFFNNKVFDMIVGICAVKSPNWDQLEYDSDPIKNVPVTVDQDSVVFDIHSLIQDWVNGERQNYGLMVRSTNTYWGLTSFIFHSSQSDPGRVPKLDVKYVTPPDFGPKRVGEVIKSEP